MKRLKQTITTQTVKQALWQTFLLLMLICWQGASGWAQQANPAMVEADELFQKQDWANAVKAYQAITTQQPNNGRAWSQLGMSCFAAGDYQQAVTALLKAAAIGHNPTIMYNLACVYTRLKDNDKAFEWLNQAAQRGFKQAQLLESDDDLAALRGDSRFKTLLERVRGNAEPCTQMPEMRQFDFWVGEWEVKTPQGQPAGQSSVQSILGKCVILENWSGSRGVNGKSFNIFSSVDHKWHQTWVDDQGTLVEYKQGEYKDGKLAYLAEQPAANGQNQLLRLTFFNLGLERVRQLGETSIDGGKTWQISFDLIYHRKQTTR